MIHNKNAYIFFGWNNNTATTTKKLIDIVEDVDINHVNLHCLGLHIIIINGRYIIRIHISMYYFA